MFIEKNLKSIVENSYDNHSGLFEKRKIKWFTLEEIENDYTLFRPHFVPILKSIVVNTSTFRDNIIDSQKKFFRLKWFSNIIICT